jgi:hypothetical protein
MRTPLRMTQGEGMAVYEEAQIDRDSSSKRIPRCGMTEDALKPGN